MSSITSSSPDFFRLRKKHYELKPNQMEKGIKRLGIGAVKKGVAGGAGVVASGVSLVAYRALLSWLYGSCITADCDASLSEEFAGRLEPGECLFKASQDLEGCIDNYYRLLLIGTIFAAVLGAFVYIQANACLNRFKKKSE
ncbi:MAG: hypothetical protein K940chlam3_00786 [Chlamydiae bacterium]|nr:hypothetical protein [Chlamydiota bacterium]